MDISTRKLDFSQKGRGYNFPTAPTNSGEPLKLPKDAFTPSLDVPIGMPDPSKYPDWNKDRNKPSNLIDVRKFDYRPIPKWIIGGKDGPFPDKIIGLADPIKYPNWRPGLFIFIPPIVGGEHGPKNPFAN